MLEKIMYMYMNRPLWLYIHVHLDDTLKRM